MKVPAASVVEMVGCLKARRKLLGISRKQVAEICAVQEFVIRMVEQGKIDPTVTLLLDYADMVDMTLTWTLGAKQ